MVFPDQGRRSDFVEVRGPKEDVKIAAKMLRDMNEEMIAENYTITVPVLQKFHRNIIGRGGAMIRTVRARPLVHSLCYSFNAGVLAYFQIILGHRIDALWNSVQTRANTILGFDLLNST